MLRPCNFKILITFKKEYRVLLDSGICIHSDGSGLNSCVSDESLSFSICKEKCSGFSACVGFSYVPIYTDSCQLYVSNGICPDDFDERFDDGWKFAKTSDDLKGTTRFDNDDWDEHNGCYGKSIQ